jgi:hypothetical protein
LSRGSHKTLEVLSAVDPHGMNLWQDMSGTIRGFARPWTGKALGDVPMSPVLQQVVEHGKLDVDLGILPVDVTIIMPCLNEFDCLSAFISNAHEALALMRLRFGLAGEILVADNGSTDGQSISRGAPWRARPGRVRAGLRRRARRRR